MKSQVFSEGSSHDDSSQEKAKRDTLNLRIKTEWRGLIDRAAELSRKNRTDFVLDAARVAAEDTFWTARHLRSTRNPMPSS